MINKLYASYMQGFMEIYVSNQTLANFVPNYYAQY